MAHHGSVVAKPWKDSTYMVMPSSIGMVPPQYSAPPPPHSHHCSNMIYAPNSICGTNSGIISSNNSSTQNIAIDSHHKSMWAVNPLYASNSGL